DLIEQARDAGALAYLVKPFQKSELLPAIEVALPRFTEMRALESEVKSLEGQLEARKVVDRAKGKLMDEQNMSEAEAFAYIRREAMNQRRKLVEVAEQILKACPAVAKLMLLDGHSLAYRAFFALPTDMAT